MEDIIVSNLPQSLDVQSVATSLAVTLVSIAISALQGSKFMEQVRGARERRVFRYVEIGIALAYRSYVRDLKSKGKLTGADANAARNLAIKGATDAAMKKGDKNLIASIPIDEMHERVEAALRKIKAEAAQGAAAKLHDSEPAVFAGVGSTGAMPSKTVSSFVFAMLCLSSMLAGCAGVDIGQVLDAVDDTAQTIEDAEEEPEPAGPLSPGQVADEVARAAEIWEAYGERGRIAPFDAGVSLSQGQAEKAAFDCGSAAFAWMLNTRLRQGSRPRDAGFEATQFVTWYVAQAHGHVGRGWLELQIKNRK